MAQACDTGCIRGNMGFGSEADYIAQFGSGCLGAQQDIYCVSGMPALGPRGCTKFFGEARSDSLGNNYTVPVGGLPGASAATPELLTMTSPTDLSILNDTCYDMQLTVNLDTRMQTYVEGAQGSVLLTTQFVLTVDGVDDPQTSGAGGSSARGRPASTSYVRLVGGYTVILPNTLAPGATTIIGLVPGVRAATANTLMFLESWNSAARVTGSTVCP